MFQIPRKRVWTSQPDNADIDWPNNGSLDFVFDGRATKSKSGRFQPEILTGNPNLSATGILGRGIGFSGGTQRVKISDLAVCAGTEGFTLEILCSVTNVASLSGFMSTGHYGSGGNSRGLIAYGGAGKNIHFWGSSSDLDSGVAWREDGSLQHVFCTSDGGSGTPMKFYRDGRLIASGTTPSIATTPASTMILGDSGQGWGASPTGVIFKASFYRKALSVAEIKARTDYPWSTFKRPDSHIFVPVSGGGGPANITGNVTATLDNITSNLQLVLNHTGTLSTSLQDIVVTSSGNLSHSTTLNISLDTIGVSIAGSVTAANVVNGTLGITLDGIIANFGGAITHTGTTSFSLDDIFVTFSGTVAGTPENITGDFALILDGISFNSSGNAGTITLTEDDINAIMNAIINNPKTLTVPKFLGLK